jgi:hypothetical protein
MPKFLIEVPHDGSKQACQRAIDTFLRTGSHFLGRAEWGCKDNVHKAWLMIDVDTKDEARRIVPAEYRGNANVVEVTQFSPKHLDKTLQQHDKTQS